MILRLIYILIEKKIMLEEGGVFYLYGPGYARLNDGSK